MPTRRALLASAGAAGLLTACGGAPGAAPPVSATRTVTHPLGTADVPVAPAGLACLEELDASLARV